LNCFLNPNNFNGNAGISIEETILAWGNNPGALLRIVSSIEMPAFQCV
jgi:hypothetical protein